MKLNGEVGILEQMSSENQNNGLAAFDESFLTEFLQSRKRDGRSRLAADTIGADFGFSDSDFNLRDLFDFAASCMKHAQGFLPRCWIADSNGCGKRIGSHGFDLLPSKLVHASVERICALRLNNRK